MGLRLKFNLVLLVVFLLGLAVTGYISWDLLQRNAREEVVRNADLMMEAALAIRAYTVDQVRPQLDLQLMRVFLPQSVPAYAATETLGQIRKKYADYTYKEATLNPTNPRNRAADWEADLVQEFKNRAGLGEMIGERDTPTGRSLYIARPIKITNPACLPCHSTPEAAPPTMIKYYGTANGFGWKLNDIIGAQIVSVPVAVPVQRANRTFKVFMLSLAGVFLFTLVMLNVMLYSIVTRRVNRLSKLADEVSLGNLDAGDFVTRSKDEIGVLTGALARMKTSMVQAIKMLEG
jgi:HAMP domain-containing protein